DGVEKVGLTAGASAPEVLVQDVLVRLREWGGSQFNEAKGKRERVVFSLPKGLV
ncbi:MAG: 4-hydroxy-3-methylbut-2-enyl diphosphate reductase, partial [Gammaproteobacteria bacterium]|nr:4-hydroxy-3-methylbut-2-enyl diphosphate reductase [Gammaproteobacteria bacterium]